ncbi:MAG: 50S ribosomal protein L25 [Bacteroidota bacterium]
MKLTKLDAQPREAGKKAAKASRRAERVPAVLYARDQDPVLFDVAVLAMRPLIYTNEAHLVEVELDGTTYQCILQDIAFHPVTDVPVHADFLVVSDDRPVRMTVPLKYVGTTVAQRKGGRVRQVEGKIKLEGLAKDIPSQVEVDVSHLDFNQTMRVRDLESDTLRFLNAGDQALYMALPPKGTAAEGEEDAEDAGDGDDAEE